MPDSTLRDQLARERTTLANERTLLSYGRTALALAASGASLLEFFDWRGATVTGAALIAAGAALVPIGMIRYVASQRRIARAPATDGEGR